mgnify:CR=1 FL=1
MVYQIFSLLLDLVAGFVGGACLLRLYMQLVRMPLYARSGNPLGPFVMALTDWIVLPLRRIFPPLGALDTASLFAAYALQLLAFVLLWLMAGRAAGFAVVPVLALFGLARLVVTGMTILVVVYAILSWVQTHSVLAHLLDRLVSPWLSPLRRWVPLVGGVDLSALVLLVLLQIAAIVVGHLQASFLNAF